MESRVEVALCAWLEVLLELLGSELGLVFCAKVSPIPNSAIAVR